MLLFFNQDNQVTRHPATLSRISFTGYIHLHAFLYTRRYINAHCFFSVYTSFSFTGSAFCGNRSAFAITGRTGGHRLHLTKKCILHPSNLATTTTGSATLYTAFIFCPAATTGGTGNMFFNFDIFGNTLRNLFIGKFQLDPEITAPHTTVPLTAPGATSLSATAKEISEKVFAKNITKLAEDIIHVHTAAATESTTTIATYACMSIPVILGFLIGIAQYFIRFSRFFEFFFSRFITRIAVRVKLHRYFAVSFFYFIRGSCFADP